MRKLALVSIAALAAAALPAAAQAQNRAGHSWGQPGQQRVVVRHGGAAGVPHGDVVRHVRRFERGHSIPQFWWGPQFNVQHWQMYGFPAPMPGHRWVRYYDDAYMIDGRGRVHEGRYGLDWDRYGDRWGRDESGIPMYVGDGDWHPGERDYEWAEEAGEHHRGGGWDYAEYGPGQAPSCAPRRRRAPCGGHGAYPAPYPAPGYGYGAGYGYGYGWGTVTITETIVETGAAYSEEVIEEEVVRQHRVRRPARRAAPPPRRPIRGERG